MTAACIFSSSSDASRRMARAGSMAIEFHL
jgi:hypothetical protein